MAKSKAMGGILVLAMILVAAWFISRAPAVSFPTASAPAAKAAAPAAKAAAPVAPAAGSSAMFALRTNWGQTEIDVGGAWDHVAGKHGDIGLKILEMAKAGNCSRILIECGRDLTTLVDGVMGYFVCNLPDGLVGIAPWRADGMKEIIVIMTGFPAKPEYVDRLAYRDNCVPIEAIFALIEQEEEYARNQQ